MIGPLEIAEAFYPSSGSFDVLERAEQVAAALIECGIWATVEVSLDEQQNEHRVYLPEYNEYWWPSSWEVLHLSSGIPQFVPDWCTFYYTEGEERFSYAD